MILNSHFVTAGLRPLSIMPKLHQIIYLLLILVMFLDTVSSDSCSWSNEHCSRDSECCSKSCFRAFEGTNPRCRHSALSEKCIFNFHCADNFECGPSFNCCSPYWKMCTKTSDCCDPEHVCRSADGFYYKRCLPPSLAPSIVLPPRKWCLILVVQSIVVCVGVVFSTSSWR